MAALEKRFGDRLHVDTTGGDNDVFDISVDGDVVFSKGSEGRFPDEREIETLIERRLQTNP